MEVGIYLHYTEDEKVDIKRRCEKTMMRITTPVTIEASKLHNLWATTTGPMEKLSVYLWVTSRR